MNRLLKTFVRDVTAMVGNSSFCPSKMIKIEIRVSDIHDKLNMEILKWISKFSLFYIYYINHFYSTIFEK